jgi:hypothetical protein
MNFPSVAHPKLVKLGDYTFQVVAFCSMTDEQALKAAMLFCRTHKLKKEDKKGIIKIITTYDENSIGRL